MVATENLLTAVTLNELQSTLVISNSKGLSETLPDIRTSTYQFAEMRKTINRTAHLTNEYVIWLLKLEIYWKYCGNEEKLLLRSNLSFFTIFCYLLLYVPVKAGTRFSLRDMRLFEMSEVEITRVDCLLVLRLRLQHKRSCNFCLSWASIFYCSELKTV